MPARSSAGKDKPDHLGIQSSLLGVTGRPAGSVNQGESLPDSRVESPAVRCSTASVSEGACWWEKYSLLIHMTTAIDKQALEPHAWVEDLLKDFFQLMLGINLSVALLSLMECLIFCDSFSQGHGMSFHKSLKFAQQLTGLHPWTGYVVLVIGL